MSLRDSFNLVLAVTVERGPLDCASTLLTPVKLYLLALVAHGQAATFEGRWQTND